MNYTNKNRISQITTLTSAAFLGLVSVAAVMLLSGPQTTSVQASSHCGMSVCLSKTASFTITATTTPATIDSFTASSPDIDYGATPPQIDKNDQPFELIWNTTNADSVIATGDWSGTKAKDGNDPSVSEPTGGTYTYTLHAINAAGVTTTDSVSIEVINNPSYTLNIGASSVELEGETGSTATVGISVTDNNFSGDVNLYIGNDTDPAIDGDDIPDVLENDDGSLVDFSFGRTTLTSGDRDTTLSMEVLQPIRTDVSPTIEITAEDPSNTAETPVQTASFQLNADGFSPRTIEEF